MKRGALVAVGGALLAAFTLHHAVPARAAGDLQGQVLQPARDLQSGLEVLIGGILGGGGQQPPPGRIDSVVVTEDAADRLTVALTCSGNLEGRRVRGELLGSDHRSQKPFPPALVRLDSGRCEADLSFAPSGGASELPASAYLRVSVDGGGAGLSRVYKLGKVWGVGSSSGSSMGLALVKVRAQPEPKAAALPATEPTPMPVWHATPVREVRDQRGDRRPRVVRDNRGDRAPRGAAPARGDRAPRGAAPAHGDRAPRGAVPAPTPASPQQRQAVLTRTARVIDALPKTGAVYWFDKNALAIAEADKAKGARGPNMAGPHELLADLNPEDGVSLEPAQVTGIGATVFGDLDPATGYFYYLPQTYHLRWLADRARYDMAMLYLAATTPGSSGEVTMAAGLTAGIDADDIKVAKALLAAYCQRRSCAKAPELRPLPIDPARVAVSLSLRLFNIPPEKVAPVGLSSASDFRLAWVTDPVTKENLQLVLEESGIDGNVTFAPQDAAQSAQAVDVQIKLADPGSFARPRWRRGEQWKNPTPYPVSVKYLHALVLDPAGVPNVYSWSLGEAVVAPGGRVECDASAVPPWIDNKALRLWIDYAIAPGCESCTQKVVKDITGGVTSVAASQITFHTINPLAEMGAHELALRVRSKRFDPEGRQSHEKSVVLGADNQDFTLGPIYVDGADGGSGTLFEYFLTVAMADGTEHEARQWIASKDLRVLVGRSQIETALGFVPGRRPGAEPTPGPQP
jgi:hypothetical protein